MANWVVIFVRDDEGCEWGLERAMGDFSARDFLEDMGGVNAAIFKLLWDGAVIDLKGAFFWVLSEFGLK